MIFGSMMGTLHSNLQNMLDIQRQISTQKKYHRLSDNPSGIARALSLQSSIAANAQFMNSQSDAITMLRFTETALMRANDIVQDIRALVIQAGNGALDRTELEAIATQIDALKQGLLDTLNTRVAGRFIFGGTDTTTRPFVMDENGRIRYVGSDERIRFKIEDGLLGDVSFTGRDIMPNEFRSYFVCSHFVPLDWEWFGREEKVQIMVGNRTLSIFIPEEWIDEVATGNTKPSDNNHFRDPEEVRGISLDDLAMLVNRSLREQGADMLVTATVEKDFAANRQRLIFRSNTGEHISVTSWPTTDPQFIPQSIAGLPMNNPDLRQPGHWNQTMLAGNHSVNFAALSNGGTLTVALGTPPVSAPVISFPASPGNITDMAGLLDFLNGIPAGTGPLPSGVTAKELNGNLALVSASGENIRVDGSAATALFGSITASHTPQYSGLMGSANTLGWSRDNLEKAINVVIRDPNDPTIIIAEEIFFLDDFANITGLVNEINRVMPTSAGDMPFASIVSGRIVMQSSMGNVEVTDNIGTAVRPPQSGGPTRPLVGPTTGGGTAQLFGQDYASGISSTTSSLTLQIAQGNQIRIFMNEGDDLRQIAERVNAIEGIYARTSADGRQLVFVAQRIGPSSSTNELNFPPLVIRGEGMAKALFNFNYSVNASTNIQQGLIVSSPQNRPIDHNHIGVFSYLNMETAMQSRAFRQGETLTVTEPLHWRVMNGTGRVTEIRLNPGEYTMAELAERLRNAGAGWLEVMLESFDDETGMGTSTNRVDASSRLVIRSMDGSPVSIMDMNNQRYAEVMGLSTALRTDGSTGVTNIRFPSAACLDNNTPAMVRVQMTCGRTFDVRLARRDVVDATTGFVDRVKVMDQIVRQVNSQAEREIMRLVIPVDNNGRRLENAASMVAVTGEPFSVVDLPILDPRWSSTHSGGIAAQMGIHGGLTSIATMMDNQTIADVGGQSGTIRFETLGGSVEIDVSEGDTVQNIMDRLRSQAGDWLYVNYFDADMSNTGNFPIISIAARDGSPVNVIDVRGRVAQDQLLLNTGIQGTHPLANPDGSPIWSIPIEPTEPPGEPLTFSITVDGFTHTIDLRAMRDINGNGVLDAHDLVATINARMQAFDVMAEINRDGFLVLWSPRGYSVTVGGTTLPSDVSTFFTHGFSTGGSPGAPPTLSSSASTAYRGGYRLEGSNIPGHQNFNRDAPGVFTQNTVVRSGSNQMQQNFFGVLGDISAAIRAENRNGLSDSLLPLIDRFMDNLLKMMSTGGALETRYGGNISRMRLNDIAMTEAHDEIVGVDLSELSTQFMMAQNIYQASLAMMAQIVQPTLLNFLR